MWLLLVGRTCVQLVFEEVTCGLVVSDGVLDRFNILWSGGKVAGEGLVMVGGLLPDGFENREGIALQVARWLKLKDTGDERSSGCGGIMIPLRLCELRREGHGVQATNMAWLKLVRLSENFGRLL